MKTTIYSLAIMLCIGCGTHGKIKSYFFEFSNNDLVIIVDSILRSNPEYSSQVDNSSGWIYFRIPKNGDQFRISIGGDSEITLISAGEKGKTTRWEKDLGYLEKKKLIESFEQNFIPKIQLLSTKSLNILKEPFRPLHNNIDTIFWPHYVLKYDTLVQYPLPKEIDSLGIDYFSDLLVDFSNHTGQRFFAKQYYHAFRIDDHYTGVLKDKSIVINGYYRVIGGERIFDPVFGQRIWKKYLNDVDQATRIEHYKEIRRNKKEQGYKETEVYRSSGKEFWMYRLDSLTLYNGMNPK